MFNPASLFNIKNAKDKFVANHPKFMLFLQTVGKKGVSEGTFIEVKVTMPDGQAINSNIMVKESDVELFDEISKLLGGK